jgi:hypothetical protein
MDSPNSEKTEKNKINFSQNSEKKVEQVLNDQIEFYIQKEFRISVPAIIFEYKIKNNLPNSNIMNKEFSGWDYDDLFDFFSNFGDVDILEIFGKIAIVLFKTFTDAYACREFLHNPSNFKESDKGNFISRWYTSEDEIKISDIMKNRMKKFTPSQITEFSNYGKSYQNIPEANNQNSQYYTNDFTLGPNFNSQYSYYASWCLSPQARKEFSNIMNYQPIEYKPFHNENKDDSRYNSNNNDKFLSNGKYTCKFEIQIDNDNEFQVSKRIIGAKVFFNLENFLGMQYEKNC